MKVGTPVALFCWLVLAILVVSLVISILDVFL
jgi:hypothetical protein|nr:MAG TPA: hypothetical protein [Microviridae sp.]DAL46173.1 MAG TPA_asm: hypothetical protein [Microviridae sp.]